MNSGTNETDRDEEAKNAKQMVSRRTFVGLGAGAVASLLAACAPVTPTRPAAATPASRAAAPTAIPPTHTPTQLPTATVTSAPALSPSVTVSPAPTSAPETAVHTPTQQTPSPTALPPTYTPVPATSTSPPPPTATPVAAIDRASLMAHWPATDTSRVIVVRHSGVWAGDTPDLGIVLQMLDEGVRSLAGVGDVLSVWRALFDPGERVLLKVNCIAYGGPTQPAVTYAVAQRLQDAGLPAEQILIFDRTDNELASAGYALNDGGAGVQCHGARGEGSEAALSQARVRFYHDLDACDAIINLPTPKQHSGAGVSVSLKNHYGSVNRPGSLHGGMCDPAIAELNAQPQIREKTRLVVGAALNVSPGDWNRPERENALLISFDPVALDTVARDILVRHRQTQGMDSGLLIGGSRHLATAQSLGLGAADATLIDLRELVLA